MRGLPMCLIGVALGLAPEGGDPVARTMHLEDSEGIYRFEVGRKFVLREVISKKEGRPLTHSPASLFEVMLEGGEPVLWEVREASQGEDIIRVRFGNTKVAMEAGIVLTGREDGLRAELSLKNMSRKEIKAHMRTRLTFASFPTRAG